MNKAINLSQGHFHNYLHHTDKKFSLLFLQSPIFGIFSLLWVRFNLYLCIYFYCIYRYIVISFYISTGQFENQFSVTLPCIKNLK